MNSRMTLYKTVKRCRVCDSDRLLSVLSLGEQHITGFTASPSEKIPTAPLKLIVCRKCYLVQLRHTLHRDTLYRKYWYRSGTSLTMRKALEDVVRRAESIVRLSARDIVLDIGSNDGTLLSYYRSNNLVKVGFEPSNLWRQGSSSNTRIFHEYFNYATFAKRFGERKAKIVTSIAMFYDLDDPNKFVTDLQKCLDKNGVWIIQMNYLVSMLQNNAFDNISHEHLEYYSLYSLEYLLRRHGFEVFDVELNDVNGGSFRVFVRHTGSLVGNSAGKNDRVGAIRALEETMDLADAVIYRRFAKRIDDVKNELVDFLRQESIRKKRIYIYGASTRGLVLLEYADITRDLIPYAVDKNPEKWGRYIAGRGIPIISIDAYRRSKPDFLLVLPYFFVDEIAKQESGFLKGGGRMITAIPSLRVIGRE